MAKTLDDLIESFRLRYEGTYRYPGPWKDDCYDAVRYLSEYRNHLKIQELKRDEDDLVDALRFAELCRQHNQIRLSFDELQKMFEKPVYFVKKSDKNCKGWIILYEIHTTEKGHFVVSTDDSIKGMKDYDFYRNEFS